MSSANSSDTQRWDGIIKPYSQKDVERREFFDDSVCWINRTRAISLIGSKTDFLPEATKTDFEEESAKITKGLPLDRAKES